MKLQQPHFYETFCSKPICSVIPINIGCERKIVPMFREFLKKKVAYMKAPTPYKFHDMYPRVAGPGVCWRYSPPPPPPYRILGIFQRMILDRQINPTLDGHTFQRIIFTNSQKIAFFHILNFCFLTAESSNCSQSTNWKDRTCQISNK